MNRYQCEGIIRDLDAGKSVVIIGRTTAEAVAALSNLEARYPDAWTQVVRANGRQHMKRNTGVVRAYGIASELLRGLDVDVAVCLGDFRSMDHDKEMRDRARLLALAQAGVDVLLPQ